MLNFSFQRTALVLCLVLGLSVASAFALAPPSPERLTPTPMQSVTTKAILERLSERHYRKLLLDDTLSTAFLREYLDSLDPQRMFFVKTDISEFSANATKFDDDLKKGDLTYTFFIYERFRQRLTSRLRNVIAHLENPATQFTFTTDEMVEIDRKDADWPADIAAADRLWEQRLRLTLLNQKLSGKEPAKAQETLLKRYKNQLQRVEQQKSADVYEMAINAFTLLYDPHTNYMGPRTSENFNINMSLSLEGIGAVLQSEDEYTQVTRLVAGGPAHKQGQLKPLDKIMGVGQGEKGEIVDVVGWRLDEVVDLIRGKKGTYVRLEVLSEDNTTKFISIMRDQVKLEDQASQKAILEIAEGSQVFKIGVIDIPAFYIDFDAYRLGDPNYRSTTRDVARLVTELKAEGVHAIVLDLRNNGGGSLQEATQLTDLFIDQGPVVQIRTADGKVSRDNRAFSNSLYSGPLVVMVNRLSASASEIFAGAIQDYHRGLIIGSQTFGKGTVQQLLRLPEGDLKLTESKFYRVSGDSTQHRGVIPDIQFPATLNHQEVGESAYDTALPWDTIHAAAHATYYNFQGIIPSLQERHAKRTENNPDFIFIREQFSLSERAAQQKMASLNEKKRIAEKTQLENEALAIENKRRLAKKQEPFKTVDAYKDHQENEEKKANANFGSQESQIDTQEDAFLIEAGKIALDLTKLLHDKRVAIETPLKSASH